MSEKQDMLTDLSMGEICRQQYDEIERKNMLLWDFEEENRLLQEKISGQKREIHQLNVRIDELEKWCGYLQSSLDREKKYNIPARIARKIKRMILGG